MKIMPVLVFFNDENKAVSNKNMNTFLKSSHLMKVMNIPSDYEKILHPPIFIKNVIREYF